MKVIDKLVDIANNGESEIIQYFRYFNRKRKEYAVFMMRYEELIYKLNYEELDINDEIEILEDTPKEDNKIEKIDVAWQNVFDEQAQKDFAKMTLDKINEIIDKLEGGK